MDVWNVLEAEALLYWRIKEFLPDATYEEFKRALDKVQVEEYMRRLSTSTKE